MTQTRRPPNREAVYVPVYTLHDMNRELSKTVPVILCTGCQHEIPAPAGNAAIQCRDCGRKMQIVNVKPATQATQTGVNGSG